MNLFSELRHRNVFGMLVLYVVGAWAALQVADLAFPAWDIPDSSIRYVWIAAVLGLPIALIFSWRFDVTVKGIKRTPSVHEGTEGLALKTADHVLLVGLSAVAIAMLAVLTQEMLDTRGEGLVPPQIVSVFEPPDKSIGVLPFENMSDDPEQAWFSAGVAVELSDRLARIKVLKVIARETMKIFERPVDVGEVAREVNAKYVLDGSVRRAGDRLRVTVQLVNGEDNTQVWTHSYDEELTTDNLLDIQTDIANAIASEMRITVEQSPIADLAPTTSISAYDAYLQAREIMDRRGDDFTQGLRLLERALSLDDKFAPAHAQLAIATMMTRDGRQIPWEELREGVVAHLDRADELQPGMAETYAGRSLLAARNRDLEAAVEWAQQALAINPNYVDAMNFLQGIYRRLGRHEESESILLEMLLIDPLNVAARFNYMEVLHESGRCKEAHDHADLLIPRSPEWGYRAHRDISLYCDGALADALFWDMKLNFSVGGWIFGLVGEYAEAHRKADDHLAPFLLLMEGRIDEGIELVDRRVRLDPKRYGSDVDTADFYYSVRSFDKASAIYERALERAPAGRPISGNMPVIKTMRLAYVRRISGDEAGAQEIAAIARDEYAKRYAAGKRNGDIYTSAGMIAAFDNEPQRAIAALRTGVHDSSLRIYLAFDGPNFAAIRNEPGFIEVRKELDAIIAIEHEKVLQLICFNNPVPNEWRPLPETCEGVVEKPVT